MTESARQLIEDLISELEQAERVIRWAVQESEGRVKRETVGGWRYHANKIQAAIRNSDKIQSEIWQGEQK